MPLYVPSLPLTGGTLTGSLALPAAGSLSWTGRSQIQSNADSSLLLLNSAGSAFSSLLLGGTAATNVMLKVNSTQIEAKLADDSNYAGFNARRFAIMDDFLTWNGLSRLRSAADAQLSLYKNDQTTGVGFDFAVDGVARVRTKAQTADGALLAGAGLNTLGTTTNSGDTYSLAASPALAAYTAGVPFWVKINSANTTTAPTLNINSLGAKTIVKRASTAMAANDLLANAYYCFVYNGTSMQCLTPTVP